ncbi:MAG: Uma2 family endonuclease [Planctomycetales bacterium]|nr:Uma2 family endonuclease [Planctomycetales bacterium]
MSIAESPPLTAEFLLTLPDDGIDRELVNGQLRERPMTRRNRFHSRAVARLSHLLETWATLSSSPDVEVYSGEVGCILQRAPDTAVGIDVAVFSAEVIARQTSETSMIEGAPLLAIEVLSPFDKIEDIHGKVDLYLNAGTSLVWIVDPYFQTVQVHRRNAAPETFNCEETVGGGEVLPGLRLAVADVFGRPGK